MADRDQLTAIATAFGRLGIPDRADRLRLLSDAVGRSLFSSSRLTHAEAQAIIGRLRAAKGPLMRAHLAKLVHAEEQAAAAASSRPEVVCTRGPGEPTSGDRETIARFAEFLHTAGPPPTATDPLEQAVELLRSRGMLAEESA